MLDSVVESDLVQGEDRAFHLYWRQRLEQRLPKVLAPHFGDFSALGEMVHREMRRDQTLIYAGLEIKLLVEQVHNHLLNLNVSEGLIESS